jgi:hypothetical protein
MNMCRNIRPLFNFDPPVTDDEVRAAALQYVRKVSGFTKPSRANEAAFQAAVDAVAAVSSKLLGSLETNAPPRDRVREAARARMRAAQRFPRPELGEGTGK